MGRERFVGKVALFNVLEVDHDFADGGYPAVDEQEQDAPKEEDRHDDARCHRMNDLAGLLSQLGDVAPDDDRADDVSVRIL